MSIAALGLPVVPIVVARISAAARVGRCMGSNTHTRSELQVENVRGLHASFCSAQLVFRAEDRPGTTQKGRVRLYAWLFLSSFLLLTE